MGDHLQLLEKEYCPPLDPALLLALASDYDTNDSISLKELRETLNALILGAEAEEGSQFDPSGTSLPEAQSNRDSEDAARSWDGDLLSRTEGTGGTSLTQSLDVSDLGDNPENYLNTLPQGYDIWAENLPKVEKEALLEQMFPSVKSFDVQFSLRKNDGAFAKTVEELLNQMFLQEDYDSAGEKQALPKGIDAFLDPSPRPRRKTKGKRRKQTASDTYSSALSASSSDQPIQSSSIWDVAKTDIEFITQRTNLSSNIVASIYHKSGTSLSATILAICASDNGSEFCIDSSDPVIEKTVAKLSTGFPNIDLGVLKILAKLAYPSVASAHELAEGIVSRHHLSTTSSVTTPIIPQYAHLRVDEQASIISGKVTVDGTSSLDYSTASTHARTYANARAAAFEKASAAYRRSKSNHLMGGAASYYSQLGRDADASARRYNAASADALVAGQSTQISLDLHFVSVRDATRITRERLQTWWEHGQREWAREGKVQGGGGYKIITGMGRHSEGGKGKLGPAIYKMLIDEGWRVNREEGVLLVMGRARK